MVKELMAWLKSIFYGSIFRRMYLLYAMIILISISFLGFWLAGDMGNLIVSQAIDYNGQQLATLHEAFDSQARLLRHAKGRLYEVRTSAQTSLYDSVELVLRDDRPFVSVREYEEYVYHANLIHTFFSLVQNSQPSEMALFQIKGAKENSGNMHILWPIRSLGRMLYAEEIYERILATGEVGPGMLFYVSEPGTSLERRFYVLYDTIDSPTTGEVAGYLINGYESKNLSEVFTRFSYPLDGEAYILRDDGLVLYSTDAAAEGEIAPFFPMIENTGASLLEADQYLYNIVTGAEGDFYAVGRMDRQLLSAKVTGSRRAIVAISLVCALVAVMLTLLSTRMLTRRVRGLTSVMRAAQEGDLTVRAQVYDNGDEMDQIAGSFNRMVERLSEYIQAEYVSELQKSTAVIRQREAELVALQHQVNPHFLYNTLEVIRMQAVSNGDQDTALLIRWLASLFRRRTRTGMVVTIREELSYCAALTEILRAKFNGEIDVTVDVPEDILDYAILKDLVQPPLENAFIHGFRAGEEEERLLRISGEMLSGDIVLRVYNNGVVIAGDVMDDIQARLSQSVPAKGDAGRHIGLINVHHRIRLAYGEGYGLQIESAQGAGTTVTLTIRALSQEALSGRITPREGGA